MSQVPTFLLPRDPRENPQPNDAVAIGNAQFTVLSRQGSVVVYERMEQGRKKNVHTSLAGWQDRMKAATVVRVQAEGVAT